jgi:hypothetical protein
MLVCSMSRLPILLSYLLWSLPACRLTRPPVRRATVCTITVNSADEKDAFRRYLPKDKFEFVELVEPGNRDWLASVCQRNVQCDVLIISGHFGGAQVGATEFYSSEVGGAEFLPVQEMERASCSDSCPGLFSHLKEVYLFGCETLSPVASQATSDEIARTLVQAGRTPQDAGRIASALNARHGETNRDGCAASSPVCRSSTAFRRSPRWAGRVIHVEALFPIRIRKAQWAVVRSVKGSLATLPRTR